MAPEPALAAALHEESVACLADSSLQHKAPQLAIASSMRFWGREIQAEVKGLTVGTALVLEPSEAGGGEQRGDVLEGGGTCEAL